MTKHTTSRYRGVFWDRRRQRWVAVISTRRKRKYLGAFVGEETAARCYDAAARATFGVGAKVNFTGGES